VALPVDRLIGEQAIVIKSLSWPLRRVRNVSGVTVLGSGQTAVILNPADPPIMMRNTIYAEVADPDAAAIEAAVAAAVEGVAAYVPGYRLLMAPLIADGVVTVMVEVEGAGDNLPAYAGNLDIMTSAGLQVAERIAQNTQQKEGAR